MKGKSGRVHSSEDARRLARRRLPRLAFDFVDGAVGRERGLARNLVRFDEILLQPRIMKDVTARSLKTRLFGQEYGVPFGIAPMGMCNLTWPGADRMMAEAARRINFPVCISSSGSSSMEEMRRWAGDRAWFQLYFGRSVEESLKMVERAEGAGYDTLVLTVDVPQLSRRVRDQRNGLSIPFRMSLRTFLDLAMHPRWSLGTLRAGIPSPRNFREDGGKSSFDRLASRAGADWKFLAKLRDRWKGNLVVKGVTLAEDAQRMLDHGVDAICVSNHGARQLDGVPAAIDLVQPIRESVGPDFPLLFDSGIRNGEDVVKALACGADFVLLGRPVLYALGADGADGLNALLNCFAEDIDIAMAQVGVTRVEEIGPRAICGELPSYRQDGRQSLPSLSSGKAGKGQD